MEIASLFSVITSLMIITVIIIVSAYVVRAIVKVRQLSKDLLGTTDVIKGIKDMATAQAYEESNTPKSVSAMTSVYLPQIIKDFPDFNYDEMKNNCEKVLMAYLNALDTGTASGLTMVTEEFKNRVQSEIDINANNELRPDYSCVKIHKTAISGYDKRDGKCIITFQSAVEYFHVIRKGSEIVSGSETSKKQAKYNITCIYIQDRNIVEGTLEAGMAINCPNCGAPLIGVGAKVCQYCQSPIVEYNIKAWHFATVQKC